jgi:hypothetical protein
MSAFFDHLTGRTPTNASLTVQVIARQKTARRVQKRREKKRNDQETTPSNRDNHRVVLAHTLFQHIQTPCTTPLIANRLGSRAGIR